MDTPTANAAAGQVIRITRVRSCLNNGAQVRRGPEGLLTEGCSGYNADALETALNRCVCALCSFSAAGDDDLLTRCDGRRLKSAKARNRGGG